MTSKHVFISHAATTRSLADSLVDLLETGIGIPHSMVFCSSLEDMGIPSGVNFVEFIRQQIREPRAVVLLLTPQYFESKFCLCELGAAWVLAHKMIPLLVSPLEYEDAKAVLEGTQVLRLETKSGLNDMREELLSVIEVEAKKFSRWELKRDQFLKRLDAILGELEQPRKVDPDEYLGLERKYGEALEEIEALSADMDRKTEIVERLSSLKDAAEVAEILAESMEGMEKFEHLAIEASRALEKLPSSVREALYYHFRKELMPYPGFGEDFEADSVRRAVEEDYLKEREDGIEVNEDDPKVEKAVASLGALESFVLEADEISEQFGNVYSKKYGHRMRFESRRFWTEHLL